MSILDRLLSKGAYSCGGDLILRNVLMGTFRNGEFHPSIEGVAEAEIDDVEVREVKSVRKAKPKTESQDEPTDLDDLLA